MRIHEENELFEQNVKRALLAELQTLQESIKAPNLRVYSIAHKRSRILKIMSLLEKINEGTFKICAMCKSEIDAEKLLANPARQICAACEIRYQNII